MPLLGGNALTAMQRGSITSRNSVFGLLAPRTLTPPPVNSRFLIATEEAVAHIFAGKAPDMCLEVRAIVSVDDGPLDDAWVSRMPRGSEEPSHRPLRIFGNYPPVLLPKRDARLSAKRLNRLLESGIANRSFDRLSGVCNLSECPIDQPQC